MEDNRNEIIIDTTTAQEEFERLVKKIGETGSELEDLKKVISEYQKEMSSLDKSIEKNTSKYEKLIEKKQELENRISELRNTIAEYNNTIDTLNSKTDKTREEEERLSTVTKELSSATKELASSQKQLKTIENLDTTIQEQQAKKLSLTESLNTAISDEVSKTNSLKDTEFNLSKVMMDLNYQFKTGNLSYQQLANTLSKLKQLYKTLPLNEARKLVEPINSINEALKFMDSKMGVYSRNVGDYTNQVNKSFNGVFVQTQQLVRELPSLANSPQQFLMAISNNLPYFIDSVKNLYNEQKNLIVSQRSLNATYVEGSAAMDQMTRSTAASTNAQRMSVEELNRVNAAYTTAKAKSEQLRLELNQLDDVWNKLTSYSNYSIGEGLTSIVDEDTIAQLSSLGLKDYIEEWKELGYIIDTTNGKFKITADGLKKIENAINDTRFDKNGELAKVFENVGKQANKSLSIFDKLKARIKTYGAIFKSLVSPISIVVIALTLLITNWEKFVNLLHNTSWYKAIYEAFTGATIATREWQKALAKFSETASKSASELKMYYKIAKDTSLADEERAKAANKVVDIMKQQGVVLDEAGVKAGKYAEQIDKVTESLVKQAKMAASMEYLSNMYKKVLDAETELENRKANAPTLLDKATAVSANQAIANAGGVPNVTPEDIKNAAVESLQKKADEAKKAFEEASDRVLQGIADGELEVGNEKSKGDGYGSSDRWKSKYEAMLKAREEALQQSIIKMEGFETKFLQWSDSEWFKYTQNGEELFNKMINEYAEHYKDLYDKGKIDKDTYEAYLSELDAKTKKYRKDSALYFDKMMKQYVHPNYQSELKSLEEWYLLEKQRYEDLGLWSQKQSDVDTEFYYKKYQLAKKFRDEFENNYIYLDTTIDLDEQELEISQNKLKQWFEDEKVEYIQAGKDITNLNIEFNRRNAKLQDEYYLKQLEKEKRYFERSAELSLTYNKNRIEKESIGSIASNVYEGITGAKPFGNQQQIQLDTEFALNTAEYTNTINTLRQEQIQLNTDLLNDVYQTEDERIRARERSAELEMEIAKTVSDYEVSAYKYTAESAKAKADGVTSAISGTFSTLGTLFTNLSELEEEGSEESKRLAIAGAVLNAMGSAIAAYQSAASIRYIGFILGPIAAAAALASGAAQVAQMQKVDATGKSSTGISNAYVGAVPSELTSALSAMPITTGNNEQLNINSGSIRAYIVDSDVNEGMNNYKNRNNNSSF